MIDPQVMKLTEREKMFLRLVASAMSSKEIANQCGVEPGTVDKALKSAMLKLGASSRRAAARILAEAEHSQKLAPQPAPLAQPLKSATMELSNEDREWSSVSDARPVLREEQMPYVAIGAFPKPLRLPFPRYEGDHNDLTIRSRLVWIGGLGLGLLFAVAALVAISWGVVRIMGQIVRPGA